MKKLKRCTLLLGSFLLLATAIPNYFFSPEYSFEITNGGHYLAKVPKEIRNVYAHKSVVPSDNYYNKQKNYSMNNIGDIESVWDKYTGKGTTIAIIDDGFDHDHPEYIRSDGTSAISDASAYFYVNDDRSAVGVTYYSEDNTCIDQEYDEDAWDTHGTSTSTTAAAPMNNGGVVGIAPDATILALKTDMHFAAIERAIYYAVQQGADVINMSLGAFAESFTDGFGEYQKGSTGVDTYLDDACLYAYNNDVIVVAAAGNEATYYKSYPACNSHVIGVGALEENSDDTLAFFTNYVSSTQTGEINVDILAPGYVYAACIDGTSSSSHTAKYGDTQGTSFSSPIIAGVASLWKQKNPSGKPAQFLSELQESADGIGEFSDKYVPVSLCGPSYKDAGPSNIENGKVNVSNLLLTSTEATGITLSKSNISLNYGYGLNSTSIVAIVTPTNLENKTVNWTSSNPEVVELSSSTSLSNKEITLTSKGYGESIITASTFDNSFSATCKVTVSEYVEISSLSLKDKDGNVSSSLYRGDSIQLYPTVEPNNASSTDFLVMSENEEIATVDESTYLVSAVGVGETDITMFAYLYDGTEINSKYHLVVSRPEGMGDIVVDLYDSSTLNNGSSTTSPTVSTFNGKTMLDGTSSDKVFASCESSSVFMRKGGVALSSKNNNGTLTLVTNSDYQIYSVTIIGALIDSNGSLKLNDKSGTGSLNAIGTVLDKCSKSLIFDNLGGVNTLKFSSTKKTVIYKIICEYSIPEPVLIESLSISPSSLELDLIKNTSASISATIIPSDASNPTLSYVSSNNNVATVSSTGLVTAKGVGNCLITVSSLDGTNLSQTCAVTVKEGIKVVSLLLDGPTSIAYMSEYDYSKLNVTLTYSNGTSIDASSLASISKIDTSKLGEQKLTATYSENGYSVESYINVKVTNNGASGNVGLTESEITKYEDLSTFTSAAWKDKNNKWTSGKSGTGFTNGGVQIAKGSTGAYATSKSSFEGVYKVVVKYCTNSSSGAGTINIKVGSNNEHSFTVSTNEGTTYRDAAFDFASVESGKVKLSVTCTTNSIYIQSITIYSKTEKIISSYPASFTDQARAWATYFINELNEACDPEGLNSDVNAIASKWSGLKDEYSFMSSSSKYEFVNSNDSTITQARNLYQMVYSKYHDSLGDVNFVDDGQGNLISSNNISILNSDRSALLLLASLIIVLAFVPSTLLIIRLKNKTTINKKDDE